MRESRDDIRMRGRLACGIAVCVALTTALGGCLMPNNGSSSSTDNEMITLAQKESLGYGRPEDVRNGDLQRLALDNFDQIDATVRPYIEEEIGRQIEITTVDATYPYNAINVTYRTLDEPLVANAAFVPLSADGTVSATSGIEPTAHGVIREQTVEALWLLAYQPELNDMRTFIATEFPDLVPLPEGYRRYYDMADDLFSVRFDRPDGVDYSEVETAYQTVYDSYLDNPDRPTAEWRDLIDTAFTGMDTYFAVNLVAEGATEIPADEAQELAERLRTESPLSWIYGWTVGLHTDLISRAGFDFHEEWALKFNRPKPSWIVTHKVDGSNV